MYRTQRSILVSLVILTAASAAFIWNSASVNSPAVTISSNKTPFELSPLSELSSDLSGPVQLEKPEPVTVDYQGVLESPGRASRVSTVPGRRLSEGRLKETLDAELQKARSGDAEAASQLAADLTSCKHRLSYLQKLSTDIAVAKGVLGERVVAAYEEIALAYIESTEGNHRCDSITEADTQAIPELLDIAVRAGELTSIGEFIAQGLTQTELMSYLRDPKRYHRFRNTAVAALEAGARRCYPYSMRSLGDLYQTGLLLPSDPVRGLGYLLADTWATGGSPSSSPHLTGIAQSFTSAQLNQAVGFAHQLYGRYCQ